MKILSLNTWAGREFDSLMDYVSFKAKDTDVFCFQEILDTQTNRRIIDGFYRANLYSELERVLKGYRGIFAPVQEDFALFSEVDFKLFWGVAMFVRPELEIKHEDQIFIRGSYNSRKSGSDTMPRNLQYIVVDEGGKTYTIAHFHGLWNGKGKSDSPERIQQSKNIRGFLDKAQGGKILCGDFNLDMNTKSLAMLEEGNVNLITKYGITSTRSPLYRNYENGSRFADYTIVSPDVYVKSFEVPKVEVSDHLPMELVV